MQVGEKEEKDSRVENLLTVIEQVQRHYFWRSFPGAES